jgi:hypothetical protein
VISTRGTTRLTFAGDGQHLSWLIKNVWPADRQALPEPSRFAPLRGATANPCGGQRCCRRTVAEVPSAKEKAGQE